MIENPPIVLITLICASPSLFIMLLFYVVFVEADLRRQEAEPETKGDRSK